MPAELTSAGVPGPGADDHARGEGPLAIVYIDLSCPECCAAWPGIRALPIRVCVRHFPIAARRPRAPVLHAAAEAAALQGEDSFWVIWDSLLDDHARVDDPHLWQRAARLGLDLERFDAERRSDAVTERVRRDFESGIRAGVVGTPTAFAGGRPITGDVVAGLAGLAQAPRRAGRSR